MRRTLEDLQKASDENLVDLEYADDAVLVLEEDKKAQVFLDELTKVIQSLVRVVWCRIIRNEAVRKRVFGCATGTSIEECVQHQKPCIPFAEDSAIFSAKFRVAAVEWWAALDLADGFSNKSCMYGSEASVLNSGVMLSTMMTATNENLPISMKKWTRYGVVSLHTQDVVVCSFGCFGRVEDDTGGTEPSARDGNTVSVVHNRRTIATPHYAPLQRTDDVTSIDGEKFDIKPTTTSEFVAASSLREMYERYYENSWVLSVLLVFQGEDRRVPFVWRRCKIWLPTNVNGIFVVVFYPDCPNERLEVKLDETIAYMTDMEWNLRITWTIEQLSTLSGLSTHGTQGIQQLMWSAVLYVAGVTLELDHRHIPLIINSIDRRKRRKLRLPLEMDFSLAFILKR
ncbi:hypothetical protein CLF_101309 [Clonorchis sinensis]|uniref:Uncharacterized protein n=1 Tax=Clonorchis sinensis TaxID=79923 RepID=G7Y5G8_CLOSI|nr:hypothetical protein CLF_101309 [Clonorchis sinensis]